MGIVACAIDPYRPDEKRKDNLGELSEILTEIEDAVVVQRHGHTDIVKRRGVALVVLYGIDIGVEHVGALQYLLRRVGAALQKVVVVGIDAGNHAIAELRSEVHQHRLLASRQVELRGQHHFKVAMLVLELAEHRAPEIDVVVALDVGHNPASLLLRPHGVGRLEVPAVDVVL